MSGLDGDPRRHIGNASGMQKRGDLDELPVYRGRLVRFIGFAGHTGFCHVP